MNLKYIIIHCSATRCNRAYSPEQLEADHRARGFRSAGYHYYIRRDGAVVRMRKETEVGAHAKGYNSVSLGICYEGGLNEAGLPYDTRTEAQKETLYRLLRDLVIKYPGVSICGHRDCSLDLDGDGKVSSDEWDKMCPCFDAEKEYCYLNLLSENLVGL